MKSQILGTAGVAADAAVAHVCFDGIGVTFGQPPNETEAVADVTGGIEKGKFVSIIGPSGCGKSTLLDVVGGLRPPSRGVVSVGGEVVTGPVPDAAMVFQEDSTLHWKTVLENVAFGLEIAGVPKRERQQAAREMIGLVGLHGFENHRPGQLSGGMKQRVAIARALVLDPSILMMDEPFGALDQQTRMFLGQELVRIWEHSRKTVCFVTHDIQEAVYLSDEVWVMSRRPSTITKVVKVELDRPRRPDVLHDPHFQTLCADLWDVLRVESQLAMGSTP